MHKLFKTVVLIVFLLITAPRVFSAGKYDGQYKGYAEIPKLATKVTDFVFVTDSKFKYSLEKKMNWAAAENEIPIGMEFDIEGNISEDGRISGNLTGLGYVGNTDNNAKWSYKGSISGNANNRELRFSITALPTILHCPHIGETSANCRSEPLEINANYTKVDNLTDDVNPTYAEIVKTQMTDSSTPDISRVMGDVQVINPDTMKDYNLLNMSKDFVLGVLGHKSKSETGAWGEGQKGMQLPLNSQIKTGTGRAVIEFADGTKFVIRENSSFRIFNGGFELERGGFYMKFEKQANGKIILKDKRSLFGIKGTELLLDVGEESTTLTVFEGSVEASMLDGKSRQNVTAGQSIKIASNTIGKNEVVDTAKTQKGWNDIEKNIRLSASDASGKTFVIPTMALGFVLGILFILGIIIVFKNRLIGIFILILSVGLGSYLLGTGQEDSRKEKEQDLNNGTQTVISPTAIPNSPVPTVLPSVKQTASNSAEIQNWKTYTDNTLGFTVKHPENVKPETYKDGTFMLSLWGPKQTEDTEFFDGISISITRKPFSGRTLSAVTEEERKGSEEVAGEKIAPATEAYLGGIKGLTYRAMDNDYYFLPLKSGYYLEILNLSADPGKLGYLDTAAGILKSLVIIP